MKYDFNKLSLRRNTNSIKWDVKDNELPMWVADMDFLVMPEIQEAIIEAAKRGSYGYSYPTEKFFNAYQRWWKDRHNILIETKSMVYVSGIISSLDSLINHLTNKGDAILLLTPCYNGFLNVVRNNDRKVVASDLEYINDDFVINYEDVEQKIISNNVKAAIFCNPHNPTGKIWSKDEIKRIYDICKKHSVLFISDEIHCDIVDPGFKYTSALNVDENIITCLAPSKVFNLAGLQSAVVVINDPKLRGTMQAAFYHDDVGEPNYFAEPATIAAYTKGDQYVDELNEYLLKNKEFVEEFLRKELPELKVVSGHATYLLWIDISACKIPSEIFAEKLREQTGLFISDGRQYGDSASSHIRMNVATSLENIIDGLNRLKVFVKSLLAK